MKIIATIATLPLLFAGLTACADTSEPEYAAVCVDPNTDERLEDDACEDGDDDYLAYAVLWYMALNSGHAYPAVGEEVDDDHFKRKLPKGKKYVLGLPKTGGSSVKSWTPPKPKTSTRPSTKPSTKTGSGTTSKPSTKRR